MTRGAGAALLAAAGSLCGLLAAKNQRDRYAQCRALCRMLRLVAFQLSRFMTPLPALFDALSRKLDGRAGTICRAAANGLESGQRFGTVWKNAISMLPGRERSVLLPLGDILGRYGPEEQAAAIAAALEDMTQLCQELNTQIKEKSRVYIGACTAGGLMLAVLLL